MESLSDRARGYIIVRVVGAEPARFLEECANRMIEFWGANPEDDYTIEITMRQKYAGLLEELAQKSSCEAKVTASGGGPEYIRRLHRRFVLWILPALFAALLIFSSFFVWKIEINGNETVSETEILNVLEECGVGIGSFWPSFTSESIRSAALSKIPELKWLSVSVFGSRAYIEVRERTPLPDMFNEDEYYKIIAGQAGIIEELSVLRGKRVLSEGQTAAQGDTLIDGVVISDYGAQTRLVHASGEAYARTWYELNAFLPMEFTKKVYSGEIKSKYSIKIGEERINFYRNSGILTMMCDNIICEKKIGIEGLFTLPVSIIRETSEKYELESASYTQEQTAELLEARLCEELNQKLGESGQLVKSEFTMKIVDGIAIGTLRAECLQDIAVEIPLTQQEMDIIKAQPEAQ